MQGALKAPGHLWPDEDTDIPEYRFSLESREQQIQCRGNLLLSLAQITDNFLEFRRWNRCKELSCHDKFGLLDIKDRIQSLRR